MKYNRLITSFLEAIKKKTVNNEPIQNFEIKDSNIHGKGVFAKKRIKPGEFINVALFKGKDDMHDTTLFGAHLNHSSKPNARTRFEGDYYRTYAVSNIDPDDEITVDYRKNRSLEQPEDDWLE
jgi:SET domain-containing protein